MWIRYNFSPSGEVFTKNYWNFSVCTSMKFVASANFASKRRICCAMRALRSATVCPTCPLQAQTLCRDTGIFYLKFEQFISAFLFQPSSKSSLHSRPTRGNKWLKEHAFWCTLDSAASFRYRASVSVRGKIWFNWSFTFCKILRRDLQDSNEAELGYVWEVWTLNRIKK